MLSDCVFNETRWRSQFSPQFQISALAETSHVIVTKFQPGERAEISALAETSHVIVTKFQPGERETRHVIAPKGLKYEGFLLG